MLQRMAALRASSGSAAMRAAMAASIAARSRRMRRRRCGVLAAQERQGEVAGAVPGGGAGPEEAGAGELELVEGSVACGLRGLRGGLDHRGHAGDEAGIDAVGLGAGADGLGEAADAGGVELGAGDGGPVQRPLERAVVGAGRLEGDDGESAASAVPIQRRSLRCPAASLATRQVSSAGQRQASRWSFEMSMPMVVSVIFPVPHACHASLALGFPFGSSGRARGDQTLQRSDRACSRAIRPAAAGGWLPPAAASPSPKTHRHEQTRQCRGGRGGPARTPLGPPSRRPGVRAHGHSP